jgi:hypothetical protein
LEKCGMQKYEQANDSIWWKLSKEISKTEQFSHLIT